MPSDPTILSLLAEARRTADLRPRRARPLRRSRYALVRLVL